MVLVDYQIWWNININTAPRKEVEKTKKKQCDRIIRWHFPGKMDLLLIKVAFPWKMGLLLSPTNNVKISQSEAQKIQKCWVAFRIFRISSAF